MDHVEAGAADIDGTFTFNVVASLEGGRGVVLGAEGAACVAGWRAAALFPMFERAFAETVAATAAATEPFRNALRLSGFIGVSGIFSLLPI